jgi:hypothetical protein
MAHHARGDVDDAPEATDGPPGPIWQRPSPTQGCADLILEGERIADLILEIVRQLPSREG